ncbi:fumarylacetoacetate hydrolase family protein [Azoarcus olearius]|uniref:Fumarylacetoacetate hydrolase family protein n=1 Tax=Azoarcus sp. (strain BH72) TaxID=418699 RepID=A1KBT8_AZOSB|nr:fumarylacetoacetate hydrolase family protein [Azoarcus olearius]ANQ86840.1 fumarylacetoacetate hydrolase family protein [Azoarcus olearius]CAL96294.1 fumarylacetoacetate hydrolase family protein [Azoarcus olearius]
MKLATLKHGGRDGTLVVVSRDLTRCQTVAGIARTLQAALDDWDTVAPELELVYDMLNAGHARHAIPFDPAHCHSPLPRAYQWADGSAYINHVELVRKARNAEVPASFYTDPLMYQGGSDSFIGPRDKIVADDSWGIDFEAEVAVVTGDVAMGATPAEAAASIRLLMLVNDVSLRNLIPKELEKGFGFFQSKPASAFSPVAVTPDELGVAWEGAKLHLPLRVELNGAAFGCPNAGQDMTFDFGQLVAHVAKTRELEAGSIIGSGTVSNKQGGLWGSTVANGGVGYCCLAELRMYETIEQGKPVTPFMKAGDRVRIEMLDEAGNNVFGTIDNTVVPLGG